MPQTKPLGRFCWYDLVTKDPEAAQPFYTQVTGWGTQVWEGSPHPYTMWTVEGTPVGGVTQLPEEAAAQKVPPHWMAHVSSPDVDETASLAIGLGGKVIKGPDEIPDVGRYAVLEDPQGVAIAIYTSAGDAPGHDGPPKQGEFSWHELVTTDHEAAFNYYSALFGWEKMEAMDLGDMGIYQIYGRQGIPLGGMFNKPDDLPGRPFWLYYVLVADVHKASKTVKELGGKILNGPMEVPGGDYIVQCMDPQGAAFALHHKVRVH